MILAFVGGLILGILIGRIWIERKIVSSASTNKVITIDGDIYKAGRVGKYSISKEEN
jgi:hypothetical protein